jgi:hypothetical protein
LKILDEKFSYFRAGGGGGSTSRFVFSLREQGTLLNFIPVREVGLRDTIYWVENAASSGTVLLRGSARGFPSKNENNIILIFEIKHLMNRFSIKIKLNIKFFFSFD